MSTEREKMAVGEWYSCMDTELDILRWRARKAVHQHNTMPPDERGAIAPLLRTLFNSVGEGAFLEAPFHCAYGFNITLGKNVYLNAGCTILDSAMVAIGDGAMLGPAVQIYCAEHHLDPVPRAQGIEIAKPVTIGRDVWIGGGAILLAGITIGDGAIVGAGSVVTRNVPPGVTVVGNPARPIKRIAD
ncbi:maltose acetyltransferase [Agrobacterium tumefaciens]|nr:sugar O-acetyltransferase [Agrobacterium tumefaciens]MBP2532436.1 maltose O-acetyltransferase [Agrobacterium tumefaciens]MBP2569102.1 maltose O-acetyltransferase [Agrobacterium tumefaciens]NSY00038.1 sugar O-acetyltransferase [Agrobacterium tumefaciens]OVE91242.1 maltose acetyltransferase [Agrobacterium tumefaciens]